METSTAHYDEKDKYEGKILKCTPTLSTTTKSVGSRVFVFSIRKGWKKNIEVASSEDAHVCFGAAEENLTSKEGQFCFCFVFICFVYIYF